MKNRRLDLRITEENYNKIKEIAPEGNVSMWVRMLIEKELDNMSYNLRAMKEIEHENKLFASGVHNFTENGTKDRYVEQHIRNIENIVAKYGCNKEFETLPNGLKKYIIKDSEGKIVTEYHDI